MRKHTFAVGSFYHLYNRGVEKRMIFMDKEDYTHFLYLMYFSNSLKNFELRNINKNFDRGETLVDIGAYCLMPNHFHILTSEKMENGITKFIHKLTTSYSMYFNNKYKRTGRLFEGVFKSKQVDSDRYCKYIYSYIHLNPAKLVDKNWRNNKNRDAEKLFNYAYKYKHSSICEYTNNQFNILNPKPFPKYFLTPIDHKRELLNWLDSNDYTEA